MVLCSRILSAAQLEAADRYNLEHISRLEIENQSICLQHRMLERKDKKLASENESMAAKLGQQRESMLEIEATRLRLEQTVCTYIRMESNSWFTCELETDTLRTID